MKIEIDGIDRRRERGIATNAIRRALVKAGVKEKVYFRHTLWSMKEVTIFVPKQSSELTIPPHEFVSLVGAAVDAVLKTDKAISCKMRDTKNSWRRYNGSW